MWHEVRFLLAQVATAQKTQSRGRPPPSKWTMPWRDGNHGAYLLHVEASKHGGYHFVDSHKKDYRVICWVYIGMETNVKSQYNPMSMSFAFSLPSDSPFLRQCPRTLFTTPLYPNVQAHVVACLFCGLQARIESARATTAEDAQPEPYRVLY